MAGTRFSVVIPNLDGAHWLGPCLGSLAGSGLPPHEVIVADDGSTDASAEVSAGAGARFLPAPRRGTGFAATANRGIAAADGDWVLLLNNDTEVDAGALAALAAAAGRHPGAGVLAPLVRSLRDRRSIDSAGLLVYPDGVGRPRWHGLTEPPAPMREEDVLLPSGAACALRADLVAEIGPLDEGMGSYLEDVDWGLRAQRAGARAVFVPEALVLHHFSGTVGALSSYKARRIERNRVIVAVRHLPLGMLLVSPLYTLARWAALALARDGGGERGESPAALARAALGGTLAGLAAVPAAVAERRRLGRTGLRGREWRRRLRAHRAGLADMRRFGAGER